MPKLNRILGASNAQAEMEQRRSRPAKTPKEYLQRVGKLGPYTQDEGSDSKLAGNKQSQSSEKPKLTSEPHEHNRPSPAPTMENPSEAPEKETDSTAPMTDTDGRKVTGSPSGKSKPKKGKKSGGKKAAKQQQTETETNSDSENDDEFDEFNF